MRRGGDRKCSIKLTEDPTRRKLIVRGDKDTTATSPVAEVVNTIL